MTLVCLSALVVTPTGAAVQHGSAASKGKAGSWRMSETGDGPFNAVSCASRTFCVAVGTSAGLDQVVTFNGKSWGPVRQLERYAGEVVSLSCPDAGWCVALTDLAAVTILQNGHWSTLKTIDPNPGPPYPGMVGAISCASTRFCMAVDGQGMSEIYDGTRWSRLQLIDPDDPLNDVSCGGIDSCVAVDGAGQVLTFIDGRWSPPTPIDDTALTGVSCSNGTFCVAVDLLGRVLVDKGSIWSHPLAVDRLAASPLSVSCPETGQCVVVDGQGRAIVLQRGRWTPPQFIAGGLDGVSCPRGVIKLCAAVGSVGAAYVSTNAFSSS